jgi:hypothetical protein
VTDCLTIDAESFFLTCLQGYYRRRGEGATNVGGNAMRSLLLILSLSVFANAAIGDEVKPERIQVAPITSAAQLDAYLKVPGSTPLDTLSQQSKQRFLASLTFSSKGLSSYRITDIERELTARQAYEIASLFGVQESISKLHFSRTH